MKPIFPVLYRALAGMARAPMERKAQAAPMEAAMEAMDPRLLEGMDLVTSPTMAPATDRSALAAITHALASLL